MSKSKETKRTYHGEQEFDHDLFLCEVASFNKNISFDPKNPAFLPIAHSHMYHSHDSNGRKITKTNSVGGHFHYVEVITDEKGALVGKCSVAKKEVIKAGKKVIENWGNDSHTHEVTYIKSDRIKLRKPNAQALTMVANYGKV